MKTNKTKWTGSCLAGAASLVIFLGGCASGPFGNSFFKQSKDGPLPPPVVISPDGTLQTNDQINRHEARSDGTAPDIMIDTSDLGENN